MAQRRMFSKTITNSDSFLEMPVSSQNLYFHLGMNADDDGFVQVKSIVRQTGSNDDDIKVLLTKGFLIRFADGVIVITAWKVNNEIRYDRYKPTYYQEHIKRLSLLENKCYLLVVPNDNQMETQVSIGKVSIGKVSKEERFAKPSLDEINSYCLERGNSLNAESFYNFYEAKGWLIGKNKMKDWKAAVRTWEQREPKKINIKLLTPATLPPPPEPKREWFEFTPEELDALNR